MRRGLISVLAIAAGLLGTTDTARAVQCPLLASLPCDFPNLVSTIGATVSPQNLPASEYVPATWNVFGKVATGDGTHPSALRQLDLDIDKDVKLNSRGYPACGRRRIEALHTERAAKACARALVGRGEATIELAFPENTPIPLYTQLLVFNAGERAGVTKLLIHAFIPVPVPTALLTVVTASKQGSGLRITAKIPVIADGYGSLLDFQFKLGRTSRKGKKVGYLEARCPDGVFKANVPKLLFKNEARVPGVAPQTELKGALAIPCTPQS